MDKLASLVEQERALRRERQVLYRRQKASKGYGEVKKNSFGASVAVEIFRRCGDVNVAVEFMQVAWRSRSPKAAMCTAADIEHFCALGACGTLITDNGCPLAFRRVCKVADGFLEERGLRAWVATQNSEKGVAPSSSRTWQERQRNQKPDPEAVARPGQKGKCSSRRSRNQWLARWARRWTLKKAMIPPGDVVPAKVLRDKATVCDKGRGQFSPLFGAPRKKRGRKTTPEIRVRQ